MRSMEPTLEDVFLEVTGSVFNRKASVIGEEKS